MPDVVLPIAKHYLIAMIHPDMEGEAAATWTQRESDGHSWSRTASLDDLFNAGWRIIGCGGTGGPYLSAIFKREGG